MKIGILSMQHVINYGSYLQAYALKRTIEKLGHEVHFISIKPGRQIINISSDGSRVIHRIDKDIIKRVQHVIFQTTRRKRFETEFFSSISINRPVEENQCDYIVIGSDEVFNCCQPSQWGFSTQLFGNTDIPTITYAASCGNTTFDKVCEYGISNEIASSLKKLVAISVRDQNTGLFVEKLIGQYPEQHLDPVLIYDWEKEVIKQNRFKDYILVYAYDNRIKNKNEIAAIKAFAKKVKKQLISFGVYQRWCDINVACSPFELLSYFDSADYVITDTFHGTVFSIKRNKQFATIVRDSNRNKLNDLLTRFNLLEREVIDANEIQETFNRIIDYSQINAVLSQEKIRSHTYLGQYLK